MLVVIFIVHLYLQVTTSRTFIKDIHTKKVMINASPLLESFLDIKEEDLVDIKEIYSAYSNN